MSQIAWPDKRKGERPSATVNFQLTTTKPPACRRWLFTSSSISATRLLAFAGLRLSSVGRLPKRLECLRCCGAWVVPERQDQIGY